MPSISSDQFAALMLSNRGRLPQALISQLAARSNSRGTQLPLLNRPELTAADVEAIKANLTDYCGADIRANILARSNITTHTEMKKQVTAITKSGGRTSRCSVSTVVMYAMGNPCVPDHLLDLFATSDDPIIVAAYAHHTTRDPRARVEALQRLESLLGEGVKRMSPDAANQAARALEKLFDQEPGLGRAQLLATRTRPILLALADAEHNAHGRDRIYKHLDAETRAHLIREAVVPVFTNAKCTQKDKYAASELVRRLAPDLDLDVLRPLAKLPGTGLTTLLENHIRKATEEKFTLVDLSLHDLFNGGHDRSHDREAAADWILETFSEAAETLGWDGIVALSERLPNTAPLAELRDMVLGVAAPAEIAAAS